VPECEPSTQQAPVEQATELPHVLLQALDEQLLGYVPLCDASIQQAPLRQATGLPQPWQVLPEQPPIVPLCVPL
jgi:hypothetical protein